MTQIRARTPTASGSRFIAALLLASFAMPGAEAQTGQQGCDPSELAIRFSHGEPLEGAGRGDVVTRLAELVNERLDGRVCMVVFSNGELFDDDAVLAAMRRGDVEMAAPHTDKFDEIAPALEVFNLPFLFHDAKALRWFENSGPGVRLLRELNTVGYVGLAYWNDGIRQMSANRPVLRPEDLKGLNIGVEGDEIQLAMYRLLGARARETPFEKLYDALKTGELQGQDNTWAEIERGKLDEVQDGVTETNHSVRTHLVASSVKFWSSLPQETRTDLSRILAFVSAEQDVTVEEGERLGRLAVAGRGGVIRQLDETARAAWIAAVQPIWDQYRAQVGPDYVDAALRSNR